MDNASRIIQAVSRILSVAVKAIEAYARGDVRSVDDILPDESVSWLEYEAREAEARIRLKDRS